MSGSATHQFRAVVEGHDIWLTHDRESQNPDVPGAIYTMARGGPLDRMATITIANITGVRAERAAIAAGIDWFNLPYQEMDERVRLFAEREGRAYEINAFETASNGEADAIDLFIALIETVSPDNLFRRPGLGASDLPVRHAEYHFMPYNLDKSFHRTVIWQAR